MTMLCRVTATWVPGLVPAEAEQPAPAEPYQFARTALSRVAADWRPVDADPKQLVDVDRETSEVLTFSRRTGTGLWLEHSGMEWPNVLALLIDHRPTPVGFFLGVEYDGRTFSLSGWAEAEAYADLAVRRHISPGFQITEARWRTAGDERIGSISRSIVDELSAVTEGMLSDTTFGVTPPIHARYSLDQLAFSADRLSVAFPGTFEAF